MIRHIFSYNRVHVCIPIVKGVAGFYCLSTFDKLPLVSSKWQYFYLDSFFSFGRQRTKSLLFDETYLLLVVIIQFISLIAEFIFNPILRHQSSGLIIHFQNQTQTHHGPMVQTYHFNQISGFHCHLSPTQLLPFYKEQNKRRVDLFLSYPIGVTFSCPSDHYNLLCTIA